MAVARHHLRIGAADRADQQPVAHRPAVDEQILMVRHAPVEGRQAGDAAQHQILAHPVDRHRIVGELPVGQRGDAGRAILGRATVSTRRPSCSTEKPTSGRAIASRRTTSRQAAYSAATSAGTCVGPARGRTVARPARGCRAAAPPAPPPPVRHCRPRAASRPRRPAGSPASAARRWRWRQRLAPEAQRLDRLDPLVGQLGGAVPLQRQRHAVGGHAATVVDHLDARQPPSPSRTAIRFAPASSAFSTSSFNALAGLSTTSPAAIRLTRCEGDGVLTRARL